MRVSLFSTVAEIRRRYDVGLEKYHKSSVG